MTNKKKKKDPKVAGSYLRTILGGPKGQPAREKWLKDQKLREKMGPPPVNEIA